MAIEKRKKVEKLDFKHPAIKEVNMVSLNEAKKAICEKVAHGNIIAIDLGVSGKNLIISLSTLVEIVNDLKVAGIKEEGELIPDSRKNLELISGEMMDISQSVLANLKPSDISPEGKVRKSKRRRKLGAP